MTAILKVDTIQDTSGNNIINENANTITIGASGDTISIPSGATITNSGTATGFGGANTPVFRAYASSNWDMSNGATTIVPYNAESFDPQSTFNTSTYKFTPAVAGKYFFYAAIKMSSSTDQSNFLFYLNKNSSVVAELNVRGSGTGSLSLQLSSTETSDTNDEIYITVYQASG